MKHIILTLSILLLPMMAKAQEIIYSDYFTQERLRADLVFVGNKEYQKVYLRDLHKEKEWSGSRVSLIDYLEYGEYFYKVFSGNKMIFSKGFNSIFQEWRTTDEATKVEKAFAGTIWMPYPKEPVKVVLYERLRETGKFSELYSFDVDPSHKLIKDARECQYNVSTIQKMGDCKDKVDVLFVAEGYTAEQMGKFRKDVERFAGYLFHYEPFKSRKNDFNIWALESVSREEGTDIPHHDIWKNTVANSNFYTFEVDRYLTVPDQTLIADIVTSAPFDAIYFIVNSDKYGGGGIYNFYGLSTADDSKVAQVFVHEFGHSLAGLADEYYYSEVAYADFYNIKLEPWEPNITTLVDFESKWKSMMEKVGDSTKVGLYEGGGYLSKGIYRPAVDCRMKSNEAKTFCPVCQAAIDRVIDMIAKPRK